MVNGSVQGSWNSDAQNQNWFTTYGYYNATTSFHSEMDFWIYDATSGETSPVNQTDLTQWQSWMSAQDSDGDGLPDWYEFTIGTNPYAWSTVNDGIPDGWKVQHGLNPLDPNVANEDPDGDGATNLQEYLRGTDPNDPFNGQPPVVSIVTGDQQSGFSGGFLPAPLLVQVRDYLGEPLKNVTVSYSVNAGDGTFAPMANGLDTGGPVTAVTDASGQAAIYFRLAATPGNNQIVAQVSSPYGASAATFTESELWRLAVSPGLAGHALGFNAGDATNFMNWGLQVVWDGAGALTADGQPGWASYGLLTASFDPSAAGFPSLQLHDGTDSAALGLSGYSPATTESLDLRNAAWSQGDASPTQFFLVPQERTGHQLVLMQPNGAFTLLTPAGSTGIPANGPDAPEAPPGAPVATRFSYAASYSPDQPFWVVDLDTYEQSGAGVTDLGLPVWQPNTVSLPLAAVQVLLDASQAWRTYTLHFRSPGGPEQLQSVTPVAASGVDGDGNANTLTDSTGASFTLPPNGVAVVTASVGYGTEFWLTRNGDGLESAHFLEDGQGIEGRPPALWRLLTNFPATPNWQTLTFEFDQDAESGLGIMQEDGTVVPLTFVANGTLFSYDNYGNLDGKTRTYDIVSATVDWNQNWWFINGAYQPVTLGGNGFDYRSPFTPTHPQQPGIISFSIFEGRGGHTLTMHNADGETWPVPTQSNPEWAQTPSGAVSGRASSMTPARRFTTAPPAASITFPTSPWTWPGMRSRISG